MRHFTQARTFAVAALLCASQMTAAAEQRAEIGRFDSQGQLIIATERFHDRFPDGIRVAELKVEISNGFYFLARKGYAADGSCRKQAVQILTSTGQPLVVGSTSAEQSAWMLEATPISLLDCKDDGCHALKYVVPSGSPPLRAARCDTTELSDNRCKCHLNDGGGWQVTNGDFCNSFIETITSPLVHWVHLRFITSG